MRGAEFYFRAMGMEATDEFFLEYRDLANVPPEGDDGSGWTIAKTYTANSIEDPSSWSEQENVYLTASGMDRVQIRFRTALRRRQRLFIDDVSFIGL